ncbi:MAG: hypothetical protein PUA84_00830 [Oscillospiraceae bacterium]|nr:hypothetical protein [Oscillospiraceae bacterium]
MMFSGQDIPNKTTIIISIMLTNVSICIDTPLNDSDCMLAGKYIAVLTATTV